MTPQKLLSCAIEARTHSYCPYSHFAVGAAVQTDDGRIFVGCNVENASFSPTICAERAAVASAVSNGARHITAVAIVGGREDAPHKLCPPCGVCRQVLCEFCDEDTPIYLGTDNGAYTETTLGALLPMRFSVNTAF